MKKEHSVSLRPVTTTDNLKELQAAVKELQKEVRDLTDTVLTQQELMAVHAKHISSIRSALSIL